MSRFFSEKYSTLVPYTPGEIPRERPYIKLNTNENPFPPSPKAVAAAAEAAAGLNLYCDPDCRDMTAKMAEILGLSTKEVLMTNGSDEALNFAFMAFCDDAHPAAFPNITYGFYPIFARLNHVPFVEIPLREDFTVNISDYFGLGKTIFLANPNAPSGLALTRAEIEQILQANPDNIVVVDEAYVDFYGESCVPLIRKYENLLVIQTFSKSRSMAGARLGFAAGCPALIADLNTVKNSINPYSVNSMTLAAGVAALEDEEYTRANCEKINKIRDDTYAGLKELGFVLNNTVTNFLFAKLPDMEGSVLFQKLKDRGILVRHFKRAETADYVRISIGTAEQMQTFLEAARDIVKEA